MLIGYARVSIQDQNPQLQLAVPNSAGCERVFQEKASGAQRQRTQLKAALDNMRAGNTLVAWKLNRLAPYMKQLIETVAEFEAREIGFRSPTESIDTTTSGGRHLLHILAGLAEFERSIVRERTRAGLAAAHARGGTGGRSPSLEEKDKPASIAGVSGSRSRAKAAGRRLGISVATPYQRFPGGHGALAEAERDR